MPRKYIHAKLVGKNHDTAYITLPDHPDNGGDGKFSASRNIKEFIPDYKGPWIQFDFDTNGNLIGIEIIVFGVDDD